MGEIRLLSAGETRGYPNWLCMNKHVTQLALYMTNFAFKLGVGIWDVIVLIPDHCLSIYYGKCLLPFIMIFPLNFISACMTYFLEIWRNG